MDYIYYSSFMHIQNIFKIRPLSKDIPQPIQLFKLEIDSGAILSACLYFTSDNSTDAGTE